MIFPICASHYVMKLFLHLSSHYKIIIFQLPIIFKISCHGKPTKWWGFCKSLRIFFTDFWYRSNAPWGVNSSLLPLFLLFFPLHYDIPTASHYVMKLFYKRHALQILIFPDSHASCYILSWEANKLLSTMIENLLHRLLVQVKCPLDVPLCIWH